MKMNKTWPFREHWEISGYLRTVTPLHIGSGRTVTRPELTVADRDELVDINAVVTDYTGKPYLPGSTIKGALHAWLQKRLKEESRTCLIQLFGQEEEAEEKKKNNHGGKAEFFDARVIFPHTGPGSLPYWDDCRQTYVAATVAIDNITRTARHRHLIHAEMVPPGVTFALTLAGPLDEEDIGLLLAALQGFNESPPALVIGAHTANGLGRFSWELSTVRRFGKEHLQGWLEAETRAMRTEAMQPLSREGVEDLLQDGIAQIDHNEDQVRLGLELCFDGPFLVNDPPTKKEQDDKKKRRSNTPNLRPLRDAIGRPCLPESSVRGALRAQAERIIRTMEGTCSEDNPAYKKEIHTDAEIEELSAVCRVFGAPGWKSLLEISDFEFVDGEDCDNIQEFVAIDRFTGGAKDKAKFNAEYIGSPRFTGTIALDKRRDLPDWGKGLLYLVLRDLAEGDITLGFGRSKGYGVCRAKIKNLDLLLPEKSVAALHKKFAISPADDKPATDQIAEDTTSGNLGISAGGPAQKTTESYEPPNPSGPGTFHNPYHFVPVVKPSAADRQHWLDKGILPSASENKTQHTHACYLDTTNGKKIYHGRIVCRLQAETPMFIGGRHRENTEPTEILPFTLGGKPAIPATSLRGMLSSIAEAASNSSLRVLEDKTLSYRKSMRANRNEDKPLSALGMIKKIETGDKVEYRLLPLTLPTLVKRGQYYILPEEYQTMFPDGRAKLKVYLNSNYTASDGTNQDFLKGKKSWRLPHGEIYYMKLCQDFSLQNGQLTFDSQNQNMLHFPKNRNNFVVGQRSIDNTPPMTKAEWRTNHQTGVPGMLRIMQASGRNFPTGRYHEIFIPVPTKKDCKQLYPVDEKAVERFLDLAGEQTKSQQNEKNLKQYQILPYHPVGTKRNTDPETNDRYMDLNSGDIVYFRPDATGTKVEEISFSSIWRDRVEDDNHNRAGVHAFFGNIDKELLPFNPKRAEISPAELLFGFVEERERGKVDDGQAPAFAGKVRVSFGRLSSEKKPDTIFQDQVTLKALSSPKPPSPALYFTGNGNGSIAKPDLTLSRHSPQGRKFYLHAWQEENEIIKFLSNGKKTSPTVINGLYPWESKSNLSRQLPDKHAKLKSAITPIKKGTVFYFHVDFDNLSEWELGLLCYALQPGKEFRHKLGMGKPIGLGSIHIEPAGLYLVHRGNRYSLDGVPDNSRYNGGIWQSEDKRLQEWQELYPRESTAAASSAAASPADFALKFSGTMTPSVQQALKRLGDPDNVVAPVHYPQVEGADLEEETYKWFVANDVGSQTKVGNRTTCTEEAARKSMLPLAGRGPLPRLKRYKWCP